MSMTNTEIREALDNMSASTARSRAELIGKAIDLGPRDYEVERETRGRADGYIEMYRRIGDLVQDNSAGIKPDELEAVEWIRENLLVMAEKVYVNLVKMG